MLPLSIIQAFNSTLSKKGLTIFCAESITAGLLSSSIASIPGASTILRGSIVTYDANVKTKVLSIDPDIIKKFTAESQETTSAMCIGIKKLYPEASIHVAVTGVASLPSNNYPINKEVGKIYISIFFDRMYEFETTIHATQNSDDRTEIREKTVEYIFDKIIEIIN